MVLHGHTDLHTHTRSPPSISLGWGQLCNPYGAQTQLGCPGVCLWGGAGASVPGDSPSASICSPPSEESCHTPQGDLASQHLAQDLYRSCGSKLLCCPADSHLPRGSGGHGKAWALEVHSLGKNLGSGTFQMCDLTEEFQSCSLLKTDLRQWLWPQLLD